MTLFCMDSRLGCPGREDMADAAGVIQEVIMFFYKPQDAWAADFIPFHRNGHFHLFYLLDWRDHDRAWRRHAVVSDQHDRFH